jgi:prepilin-type N-terminal cleavage/methylation domain-containing protein
MKRPGLTLIELVVMLAILAILATVAVVMTESTLEQAKYDATQRTLDNIQEAVMGTPDKLDAYGEPQVAGFLADTGVLPQAVNGDPLAELTSVPTARTLKAFSVVEARTEPDDPFITPQYRDTVPLPCGWRGPYLKTNTTVITDGWGNAFVPLATTNGFEIASRGGASPPYIPDSQSTVYSRKFEFPTNEMLTIYVTGTATATATTQMQDIELRIFVPDASTSLGYRVIRPNPASSVNGHKVELALNQSGTDYLPQTRIAVRAYLNSGKDKSIVYYENIRRNHPVRLNFDYVPPMTIPAPAP